MQGIQGMVFGNVVPREGTETNRRTAGKEKHGAFGNVVPREGTETIINAIAESLGTLIWKCSSPRGDGNFSDWVVEEILPYLEM